MLPGATLSTVMCILLSVQSGNVSGWSVIVAASVLLLVYNQHVYAARVLLLVYNQHVYAASVLLLVQSICMCS